MPKALHQMQGEYPNEHIPTTLASSIIRDYPRG